MDGFRVVSAGNGNEALSLIAEERPDLVVLDIVMPIMNGFQTLKKIREVSSVPVIFCSSKDEEDDRVMGLNLGADDYIVKPFSLKELVSRIRAVMRRTETDQSSARSQIVLDNDLRIDFYERKITVRGQEVHLRPTEQRLLYELVTHAGQILSYQTLLSRVWGPEYKIEENYVRLYITYLRQKIERNPKNPKYILSERGLGYRFKNIG